ncbi:winged helix-turn-helix transcriptional regulator [Chitinophaga skermanii]|nr:helix-turn-helix domain-containing protein [Chitinophaga skermanii]
MAKLEKCTTPNRENTLALRDAIELLSGKWKVCILHNLANGALRFSDLKEEVVGITPKVLSKELLVLEQHKLITRTVHATKPITVSYALTEHAHNVQPVIQALATFGIQHRAIIKGQ